MTAESHTCPAGVADNVPFGLRNHDRRFAAHLCKLLSGKSRGQESLLLLFQGQIVEMVELLQFEKAGEVAGNETAEKHEGERPD